MPEPDENDRYGVGGNDASMLTMGLVNTGSAPPAAFVPALTAGTGGLEAFGCSRLDGLKAAARSALECGEAAQARRLINEAFEIDSAAASAGEWAQMVDEASWADAWLVAAVRREPPDEAA